MNQQEIRMRELEIAVEANQTLLTMESEKSKRAVLQIAAIGRELGGVDFDAFLQSHNIEEITPEQLAIAIIGIVKANLALLNSLPDAEGFIEFNRQLTESRKLADSQTRRADEAEEEIRVLKRQVAALEAALADLRQENQKLVAAAESSKIPAPAEDPTQWFEKWHKLKSFNRNSQTIQLIGETGWARELQIVAEGAKRQSCSNRRVKRSLENLCKESLIECEQVISTGGSKTCIVKLTDKGCWAYTKITGAAPLPSEYDALLKAHVSERQATLVLKACDLFEALGFDVNRHPEKIKIEENRYFRPDFIMAKDGRTYYVEFETGIGPNRASLAQKWENAAIVGGARICLVTPNSSTMHTVCGNIVHWANERGRDIHVYATNLELLKRKTPGETPWVIDKDR